MSSRNQQLILELQCALHEYENILAMTDDREQQNHLYETIRELTLRIAELRKE